MVFIEKSCKNATLLHEFASFIRSAIKKRPISFEMKQNLELQRIQLEISQEQFRHCCFLNHVNPSLFTPTFVHGKCAFCGKDAKNSFFCFSPFLEKRLYMNTELRPKDEDMISVCNDCMETANYLVKQTERIHQDLKFTDEQHTCVRQFIEYSTFDFTIPHDIVEFQDMYPLNDYTDGVLRGTQSVLVEGSTLFQFVLPFPSEVEHIVINVDKIPNKCEVSLMNEDGTFDEALVCDSEPNILWIGIKNPVSLRQVTLSFRPFENINVTKLTVFAQPSYYIPHFTQGTHQAKKLPDFTKKESISPSFNEETLTHTFTITKENNEINEMYIRIENKNSTKDKLISAVFYDGPSIVCEKTFNTGESNENSVLYYYVNVPKFNSCLFYHLSCVNESECANITVIIDK